MNLTPYGLKFVKKVNFYEALDRFFKDELNIGDFEDFKKRQEWLFPTLFRKLNRVNLVIDINDDNDVCFCIKYRRRTKKMSVSLRDSFMEKAQREKFSFMERGEQKEESSTNCIVLFENGSLNEAGNDWLRADLKGKVGRQLLFGYEDEKLKFALNREYLFLFDPKKI